MLLVLLHPPNFSEGNRTTLKSPPHHLSPHRPYTLANFTQKYFLSLGLQGP
ncbi:hypothetical protein LguiB_024653 [Lonicera macranthoides]